MSQAFTNAINKMAEDLRLERQNHDAEILRIAMALGYEPSGAVPEPTVEDIVKQIKRLKDKM